jgi:flagellar biosynthesis/type III secretory pathway M-ring protein FliF/YscJ
MFYVRNMTTTETSSSRAVATSSAPPGQVPSPSTTPETEGPRKSKEETSSGSIVEFVVGITLAVIIIIGFIVVTLFKRLQRKKASKAKIAADCSTMKELVPGAQEYTPVPQEVYVRPAEMEGSRTCAELPAEGGLPRVEELDVTSREGG